MGATSPGALSGQPRRRPIARKTLVNAGALIAVALVAAFLWLRGLGLLPIENGDEAIVAVFVRNALRGHGWVWLRWGGASTYQRPPLAVWLYAVVCSRAGAEHLAESLLRLGPALAGLASLVLAYLCGARAYRSRAAGLFAALLLGAAPTFAHFNHRVFVDPPMIAFLLLALYGALRADEDPRARWPALVGMGLGLAVATKSVAGLLAAPALAAALWTRASGRPRGRALWFALGAFLLPAVPWYAAGVAHGGREFLAQHFGFNLWQRARGTIVGVGQVGPAAYLKQLWELDGTPGRILIAGPLLAGGWLFAALRGRGAGGVSDLRRPMLLFLSWAVSIGLVLASVRTRLPQYLLPVYPSLALAAAGCVALVERRATPGLRAIAAGMAVAAGLALFALTSSGDAELVERAARAHVTQSPARELGAAARRFVPESYPIFAVHYYPMALAYYGDRDVVLVEPTVDAARAMDAIDVFHNARAVRYVPDRALALLCDDGRALGGQAPLVAPDEIAVRLAADPALEVRRVASSGGLTLLALRCRSL